ncbi:redoxin domain-containing protein [Chitinophaga vietnamensis]|uniref:redoxin domain-containing protein n=1 Tax=Chitinophaga vietnamensis TaxID=2593957 RepID=UPI001178BC1F|nr:redoxin domain-containing protein [Chitinophaga vietnamensis]
MSTIYRYADYLPQPVPERFASPLRYREQLNPIAVGKFFPEFFIEEAHVINGTELLQPATAGTSIHRLTAQPLIVAFYSVQWNGYGDRLLQQLLDSHDAITAAGAHLLVLSAEDKKEFRTFNTQALPFDVAYDAQFRIARKAGVYHEKDPLWGRVAGTNADVPAPAVFLLTPSLEVKYVFADTFLQYSFQPESLLAAIDSQLAISA